MSTSKPDYPLLFKPIYKEKIWGGRALEQLGKKLPAANLIGESWEVADLGLTSVSGGGGSSAHSAVINGPLAGKTLHDLLQSDCSAVLGTLPLTSRGEFPLLIKYLDARQNLSVQVHPSNEYAKTHPEAHLKNEAWYIVSAQKNAVIYKGVKKGVTKEQFRQAIESGDLESLLIKINVKPGQCHYLPSGTCHALGAGVVVAEVQTPSDTTFRVFDWGRTKRQLHIDQALECIKFGPADTQKYEPDQHLKKGDTQLARLVQCEHFIIESYTATSNSAIALEEGKLAIWMCLCGSGKLQNRNGYCLDFSAGDTVLIPASMKGGMAQTHQQTKWLRITIPAQRTKTV